MTTNLGIIELGTLQTELDATTAYFQGHDVLGISTTEANRKSKELPKVKKLKKKAKK